MAARDRGCYKNSPIYIRPPSQNRPRSGDAKQIIPLTGDDTALARAHAQVIPNWGVGVGVLSLERVHCDTGTVTPYPKQFYILHTEHPRRAPPQGKYG